MQNAGSVSADKEKAEKANVGTILHKIWNETAKAEQAYRREKSKRYYEVQRLWGIFGAVWGQYVYKTIMDHDHLTEDDKKFVTYMKNLGVEKKFEKKAPEKVIPTPAEIQKRATAQNL